MPKLKRVEVVSAKCKRCALFGPCKGRVLPPDEFCLGYKDRQNISNIKLEPPPQKADDDNIEFTSGANNGSICDNCIYEFDGLCKLTWLVALYKVTSCADFKIRNREAV